MRLLGALLFFALSVFCFQAFLATVGDPDRDSAEGLRRRAAANPLNPEIWSRLGRLQTVEIAGANPQEGLDCLIRAARVHPWDYRNWADLAAIHDSLGNSREALLCMENAVRLNRTLASFLWDAGNFFLRRNDLDRASSSLRQAMDGNPDYVAPAMAILTRATPDPVASWSRYAPTRGPSLLACLRWCMVSGRLDLAIPCWKQLQTCRDSFPLADAMPYVHGLIEASRYEDATRIWKQAVLRCEPERMPAGDQPVFNGSFELPLFQGGLDWRLRDSSHLTAKRDQSSRFKDFYSLLLEFDGGENLAGPFLHQWVYLPRPGRYQLRYAVKAENLSTDQGVSFRVVALDRYPSYHSLAEGPMHLEEPDWHLCSVPFQTTSPGTFIEIRLWRDPSRKLDNLFRGRLWLDAVEILPEASQ